MMQAFSLVGAPDEERILALLSRLGYVVADACSTSASYTYFDTQGGVFWKLGLRLTLSRGDVVWQILKGHLPEATLAGLSVSDVLDGDSIEPIHSLTRGQRLLPYLEAAVVDRTMRLSFREAWVGTLHFHFVEFQSPLDREQKADCRFAFFEPRFEAPLEASHLNTMLRDLGGLATVEYEPFAAGIDLLDLTPPGAPFPRELALLPADTAATVAAKILARQAYQMRANTAGAVQDLDPEFVHDIRVATRRARFALRRFRGIVDPDRARARRDEIAVLARSLGSVRDLDVFTERMKAHLSRIDAPEGFSKRVLALVAPRREAAQEDLVRELRSEQYLKILEELSDARGPLFAPPGPAEDARSLGARLVRRAVRGVRRDTTGDVRTFAPERLHRIRIAFKGLRYTCDFFKEVFADEIAEVSRHLAAVQDCLGDLQDGVTALHLLGELRDTSNSKPAELLALGALLQVQREEMARRTAEVALEIPQVRQRLRKLGRALRPFDVRDERPADPGASRRGWPPDADLR